MESAPAAIPATRQATFTSGYAPVFAVICTWRRTRPARAARSASAITGTARPATRDSGHQSMRAFSSDHATIASSKCPSELAR